MDFKELDLFSSWLTNQVKLNRIPMELRPMVVAVFDFINSKIKEYKAEMKHKKGGV